MFLCVCIVCTDYRGCTMDDAVVAECLSAEISARVCFALRCSKGRTTFRAGATVVSAAELGSTK
jgi:hypothetical protein